MELFFQRSGWRFSSVPVAIAPALKPAWHQHQMYCQGSAQLMQSEQIERGTSGANDDWHYHPFLPLQKDQPFHWPPLYRRVHALHHNNVNIGPWSGLAMLPVEHLVYFSSSLIHLLIPSHPLQVFWFYLTKISENLNQKTLLEHGGFFPSTAPSLL